MSKLRKLEDLRKHLDALKSGTREEMVAALSALTGVKDPIAEIMDTISVHSCHHCGARYRGPFAEHCRAVGDAVHLAAEVMSS